MCSFSTPLLPLPRFAKFREDRESIQMIYVGAKTKSQRKTTTHLVHRNARARFSAISLSLSLIRRSVCHWELTGELTSFLAQARGHVVLQFAQRRRLQGLKVDFDLVRIRVPKRRLPVLNYVHHTAQLVPWKNYKNRI